MPPRALVALAVFAGGVVLLFVVALGAGFVKAYRVPSSAMETTLRCARPNPGCTGKHDDRILAVRFIGFSPKRGDIVAFHTPAIAIVRCGSGGIFVKRVVALPGERWEERTGFIYVDGKRLVEPYVPAGERDRRTIAASTVPKGRYVMLGDNRSASCDSRSWGTVPKKDLIGKVFATYWPPGRVTIR